MRPLTLPHTVADTPKLGFFPGSTIGNMIPLMAVDLLRAMRASLGEGAMLLIGMDRIKDEATLVAAYDDAGGVTAAFNRNLLVRIQRELGAILDVDGFAHRAFFDPAESRIEMHLVSRAAQTIRLGAHVFTFAEGETIHTENSYKYTREGFRTLADTAGWTPCAVWTDPDDLFSVHALRRL